LGPECYRFTSQKLEVEVYGLIERLIVVIGSPQVALDERHTPKLYSRFLASSLAKHKREGAAYRSMQKPESSTPQFQRSLKDSVYQQPQLQPTPILSVGSTPFVPRARNAITQDWAMDDVVTGTGGFINVMPENAREPGFDNLDILPAPDFPFGTQGQHGELMDFTFNPIIAPGNEDILAGMEDINPTSWQVMPKSAYCFIYTIVGIIVTDTPLQLHFAYGRIDPRWCQLSNPMKLKMPKTRLGVFRLTLTCPVNPTQGAWED
jgi:hypothetical protein